MGAFIRHTKVFGGLWSGKRVFHVHKVWSEPDFGDLHSSPQIYPEDSWHVFELYGPNTNYLIEWRYCFNVQYRDIHTRSPMTIMCQKEGYM